MPRQHASWTEYELKGTSKSPKHVLWTVHQQSMAMKLSFFPHGFSFPPCESSLIILCHFVPLLQAPAIHSLLVANLAALRKKIGNSWACEGWKAMTWDLFGKFRGNPWKPPYVIGRTMVSCGFSPKPIHLCVGRICFGSLSSRFLTVFAFWGYGSIM